MIHVQEYQIFFIFTKFLLCPFWHSEMEIISIITENGVIEKILKHLELLEKEWNNKSPRKAYKEEIEYISHSLVEENRAVNF